MAQLHGTVQAALDEVGKDHKMADDNDGFEGEATFLFQPKSYLVIGTKQEFLNELGQKNKSKIRSFELFRANITSLEIITYDELFERAKWMAGINGDSGDVNHE
ncbi:MAG: DUF4263 domain-containing protein [Bifidobacterium sp.]|nr:DUF4263 domain-containing protein [Bifidobacterium sp.]